MENTADDPWYYFAYDEGWRIVATYRAADTSPKEQFVYHNAGLDGYGGSSAIDGMILRDKDANTAWIAASDGTLDERVYSSQNWRGDRVALIDDSADLVEEDRYSANGVPFGLPAGDADSDGDVDSADLTQIQTWIDGPTYDVRGDLDLDGDVDATDKTAATNNQGTTLGWGNLSASGVDNRKGYGGYELDPVLAYTTWHVRNRVLISDLGRWITRDPAGYVGGINLYQYVSSNPLVATDPQGLVTYWGGGPIGDYGRRTPPDPIPPPGSNLPLVPCGARRPAPQPIAPPGSGPGFAFGAAGFAIPLEGAAGTGVGISGIAATGVGVVVVGACTIGYLLNEIRKANKDTARFREKLRRPMPPPRRICETAYLACLETQIADGDFGDRCFNCRNKCYATGIWPVTTWDGKPCI